MATSANTLSLLEQHPDFFDSLSFSPNIFAPGDIHQNDITLLIPSNDAFAKIASPGVSNAFKTNDTDAIRSILEYHVISRVHDANSFTSNPSFLQTWLSNSTYSNVTAGQVIGVAQNPPGINIFNSGLNSNSTLTTPDLKYTNGIIHIIDTFLTPPADLLPTAAQLNLTAFTGALTKANLLTLASTTPDITIFCPTDAAFGALGSSLETMPEQELEDLLRYHIVVLPSASGAACNYSPRLVNGAQLSTIFSVPGHTSAQVAITSTSNSSLFVNSARITQLDILLANGVMHVIDNVLSPNDASARPGPS